MVNYGDGNYADTHRPIRKKEKKESLGFPDCRPKSGTNAHSEYGFQETSNHPPSAGFKPPRPEPSIFHIWAVTWA